MRIYKKNQLILICTKYVLYNIKITEHRINQQNNLYYVCINLFLVQKLEDKYKIIQNIVIVTNHTLISHLYKILFSSFLLINN